jgi:hypothetical protein
MPGATAQAVAPDVESERHSPCFEGETTLSIHLMSMKIFV